MTNDKISEVKLEKYSSCNNIVDENNKDKNIKWG